MSRDSDMIDTIFQLAGPMAYLDAAGRVTSANRGLLTLLGVSLDDILDTPLTGMIYSPSLNESSPENLPAPDGGRQVQFKGVLRSLDLACLCSLVRLPDGETDPYLITIEPQPGLSSEPVAGENELRHFLDHLSGYIFKIDLSGIILFVSYSVIRRTGLDEDEIVGSHWSKFPWFTHDEATFEMVKKAIVTVIQSKEKQQQESKIRSVHGDDLIFVLTLTPVLDQQGEVEYMIIEGSDLTKLRFSEEKLLLFATAVTQSPYGIAMADLKGEILFVNDSWARMHEYGGENLIGRNLSIFHTPEQMEVDVIPFNDLLMQLGSYEGEVGHVTRNGKIIPTWMNSSVIRDSWGVSKGIVGMARDISKQLRSDKELQQAKEDAEEASRVKSRFLANVSHEIRTPLNGIIGMTNLTLDSTLSKEQRENLTMASSSAHHLLGVINDILDLSKVEAGQLELESIPFRLDTVLGTTLDDLAVTAEYKKLELLFHIDGKIPPVLLGDPHRLRQILTNLIGNAIKFTREGEVLLQIKLERDCNKGVCLHFSIIDTGIGIPLDRQTAIFDSFTQADDSISRHFGGSGLGTTIARDLVEMMQGRIWLVSPVNERDQRRPGSAFHFTATFEQPTAFETSDTDPDPDNLLSGRHLLVIEANDTRRRLLRKLLANHDLKTSEAFTLEQAKEMLGQDGKGYDFIFAGSDSPALDVRQLIKQLHLHYGENKPPVVVSTPMTAKLDKFNLAALGGVAQLTRPLKVRPLLEIMLNIIQDRKPRFENADGSARRSGPDLETVTDPQESSQRLVGEGLKILVAEDNMVNQMLVRKLLLKKGYSVQIVGNGEEAIQILKKSRFDLLLLDIQMPILDGFGVTRHLREREREGESPIKILALTAASMSDDRERCLAAGMDGYITKPVDAQELYRAIEELTTP